MPYQDIMERDDNTTSSTNSWMDDLTKCNATSTGYSTNQIYRDDGSCQEAHKYGDRSFHCFDEKENIGLYAIFSGQNGCRVAESAMQRIAADILLGEELKQCQSEDDVKDILLQIFLVAEEAYKLSVGSLLARKTYLQCEIPDGLSQYEISLNYKEILNQIKCINNELSIGASAVLALVYKSNLYICNIGNCRALLCKHDSNSVLRVVQLSVDHNLSNEDEILRLCRLGLDVATLKQAPIQSTRCIGNYFGKMGYKDCEWLSEATSEPILSKPEIVGPIPLDGSCRFLLLMSGGLAKALQDIYAPERNLANRKIVEMVVEQFRTQTSLMGVSQSTVHKIVQLHHEMYIKNFDQLSKNTLFGGRDDCTLLVRNFNYPMPNTLNFINRTMSTSSTSISSSSLTPINQPLQLQLPQFVTFNSVIQEDQRGGSGGVVVGGGVGVNGQFYSHSGYADSFNTDTNAQQMNTNSSDINDVDAQEQHQQQQQQNKHLKIRPYVDFNEYYKNVAIARENGTLPLNIEFD